MSAYEVVEAPGDSVPFSLEPILVELERGRYIILILPIYLSDLVKGRRPSSSQRCRQRHRQCRWRQRQRRK